MKIKYIHLLIFLGFEFSGYAQLNPPENSVLNYTQIMFEYPKIPKADSYIIQIAPYDSSLNFKDLITTQEDQTTATMVSHLYFGEKYMWRYCSKSKGVQSVWQGPYVFEIADNPSFKMSQIQARVIKNESGKNDAGMIAIDYDKIVIDKSGNPAWYLPNGKVKDKNTGGAYDMRITKQGTITFRANNKAYECDINGNIIWEAPNNGKVSGDTTEYYHHDFRKLNNGNYMILGEKYSWRTIPENFDVSKFRKENLEITDTSRKVKIMFNTIIEYDKSGKVVWSWNAANYFSDLDLFSTKTNTNLPRRDLPANAEIFAHMNSFDTDSTGSKFVYASLRDVNRVIKIDKKTGKVVESWGEKMPSGDANQANDFFINQHDLNVLTNGNLLVFDNNDMSNNSNTSAAVEFSPRKGKIPSKIIWRFDCKFDSITNGKSVRNGSVEELPNRNMLICMSGNKRIVEVNKSNNRVVWDAFLETRPNDTSAIWNPLTIYKAHYASSLYPCYFTVQSNKDLVSTTDPIAMISVFNEGTNSDSYIIDVQPATINFKKIETGVVASGKSKAINISMNMVEAKATSIILIIKSKTNPDLVRKLSIKVKR